MCYHREDLYLRFYGLRFSHRWLRRVLSYVIYRRVFRRKSTNVSEGYFSSVLGAEEWTKRDTSMKQTASTLLSFCYFLVFNCVQKVIVDYWISNFGNLHIESLSFNLRIVSKSVWNMTYNAWFIFLCNICSKHYSLDEFLASYRRGICRNASKSSCKVVVNNFLI
jgi:hypothetical protein